MGERSARSQASHRATSSTSRTATNTAALSNLRAGNIDLFNNFAPKTAIKGKFKTFYSGAPYHLGANTTWLFPNTTKKPLDDKAVPHGARLLDQHEPDPRQGLPGPRQQGEPDRAPADLGQVGRQEGRREATASRTTSTRRRRSSLPPATRTRTTTGSSRTRTARRSTSRSSLPERVVRLDDVDPGHRRQRQGGRHQDHAGVPGVRHTGRRPRPRTVRPAAGNDRQYSNTPWTYYQYIFQLPILDNQTTVNYERYQNQTAWNLTQQLDKTPSTNTKAYQAS